MDFVCKRFGVEEASVSVAIVGDETISHVHSEFMNDPATTDVISFNLSDEDDQCPTFEMVVNYEMAKRISADKPHSDKDELYLYILHGLLHNLGFDDLCQEDFNEMHKEEDDILEELGVGRIFGQRDFQPKNGF